MPCGWEGYYGPGGEYWQLSPGLSYVHCGLSA